MRKLLQSTILSVLFIGLCSTGFAQKLQLIHNAADPAVSTVDVYVQPTSGGPAQLYEDDLDFRTATGFRSVDANTYTVGLAPGNSNGIGDTLKSYTLTVASNTTYTVLVTGVLNPSNFATNPDNLGIEVAPYVVSGVDTNSSGGNVSLTVAHGVSDAPAVDIFVRELGSSAVVNDAAFGAIEPNLSVPAADVTIDIAASADSTATLFSHSAHLASAGLADSAITVFASGFLDSTNNQNGPAWGLFAATAGGTVIELAQEDSAKVQMIHNSPDVALDSVDVYLNGASNPSYTNVKFRNGTPFLTVPANEELEVGLAPSSGGGGTTRGDIEFKDTIRPKGGAGYYYLINGVTNPALYEPNPDGINISLSTDLIMGAKETAPANDSVEAMVYHGSTDAPTVDIQSGGQTLVDDAAYTDHAGYLTLENISYNLEVYNETGSTKVGGYTADLSTLGGSSVFVFASGFFNEPSSTVNENGEPFGLFALPPAGGEPIALPVGVQEIQELTQVTVYPNPVQGQLNITLETEKFFNLEMDVLDVAGRQVKNRRAIDALVGQNNLQLSVDDLVPGAYFIRLSNGEQIDTYKFIKQ